MDKVDWSKAPEGATHYCHETEDYMAAWFKRDKGGWYFCLAVSTKRWVPFCGDFPERMTITERPQPAPTWSGAGLPPVGIVCEFLRYDRDEEEHTYSECKVLAHDDDGSAVFRVTSGPGIGSLTAKYAGDFDDGLPMFRPIRTAEQIAAEERKRAVEEMVALTDAEKAEWARNICADLYDAGYRKVEGGEQ